MNLKKFISGISALTVAASAFAAVTITANATSTNATLVHTAHAAYSQAAGNGASADNATEYYNNDGNSGWISYAFAEFSFSLPAGETITNATLTWRKTASKNYNTVINYLNAGQTIDYSTLTTSTNYRYNGSRGSVATVASGTAEATFNTDVTTAVQTVAASQNYIIFQFTGHSGSANLYGKASEQYAPSLVITTTSETLYEATFTETHGADVNVTVYSDSARTTSVAKDQLRANTTYYYTATATGYEDYNGQFDVAEANVPVSFTMTARTVAGAVTISYKDTNDVSIASNTTADVSGKYVGDSLTYAYPKYIANGGNLYKTTAAKTRAVVSLTAAAQEVKAEYNVEAEGTYYVYEFDGGYTTRADDESNGSAATHSATVTVPADGIYTVTANCYGSAGGRTATVKVGDNNVIIGDTSISIYAPGTDLTASNVTLHEGDVITATTSDSNSGIDYVILQKTGDLPTAVATLEEDNITDDTQYTGADAGATYSVFKATVTAGTNAITSLYFTLNNGAKSTAVYDETTITAGSPAIFGLIVPMASSAVEDITAVINGDSYVAFE